MAIDTHGLRKKVSRATCHPAARAILSSLLLYVTGHEDTGAPQGPPSAKRAEVGDSEASPTSEPQDAHRRPTRFQLLQAKFMGAGREHLKKTREVGRLIFKDRQGSGRSVVTTTINKLLEKAREGASGRAPGREPLFREKPRCSLPAGRSPMKSILKVFLAAEEKEAEEKEAREKPKAARGPPPKTAGKRGSILSKLREKFEQSGSLCSEARVLLLRRDDQRKKRTHRPRPPRSEARLLCAATMASSCVGTPPARFLACVAEPVLAFSIAMVVCGPRSWLSRCAKICRADRGHVLRGEPGASPSTGNKPAGKGGHGGEPSQPQAAWDTAPRDSLETAVPTGDTVLRGVRAGLDPGLLGKGTCTEDALAVCSLAGEAEGLTARLEPEVGLFTQKGVPEKRARRPSPQCAERVPQPPGGPARLQEAQGDGRPHRLGGESGVRNAQAPFPAVPEREGHQVATPGLSGPVGTRQGPQAGQSLVPPRGNGDAPEAAQPKPQRSGLGEQEEGGGQGQSSRPGRAGDRLSRAEHRMPDHRMPDHRMPDPDDRPVLQAGAPPPCYMASENHPQEPSPGEGSWVDVPAPLVAQAGVRIWEGLPGVVATVLHGWECRGLPLPVSARPLWGPIGSADHDSSQNRAASPKEHLKPSATAPGRVTAAGTTESHTVPAPGAIPNPKDWPARVGSTFHEGHGDSPSSHSLVAEAPVGMPSCLVPRGLLEHHSHPPVPSKPPFPTAQPQAGAAYHQASGGSAAGREAALAFPGSPQGDPRASPEPTSPHPVPQGSSAVGPQHPSLGKLLLPSENCQAQHGTHVVPEEQLPPGARPSCLLPSGPAATAEGQWVVGVSQQYPSPQAPLRPKLHTQAGVPEEEEINWSPRPRVGLGAPEVGALGPMRPDSPGEKGVAPQGQKATLRGAKEGQSWPQGALVGSGTVATGMEPPSPHTGEGPEHWQECWEQHPEEPLRGHAVLAGENQAQRSPERPGFPAQAQVGRMVPCDLAGPMGSSAQVAPTVGMSGKSQGLARGSGQGGPQMLGRVEENWPQGFKSQPTPRPQPVPGSAVPASHAPYQVMPPEDPRVGRGHVPLEDPGVGRQGVPPEDTGVGRQAVPLEDPGVGRWAVLPEDPRVGKQGVPPEDTGVGRWGVPWDDTGAGRGRMPPEDPGVGKGQVPLEDPRVGRQGVPLKDPGVGRRGVPRDNTGVGRGHVSLEDPRVGRWTVPPEDPGVGRRAVPPEDPGVGRWGVPPEDPGVGKWGVPPEDPRVGKWGVPPEDPRVGRGHVPPDDPRVGRQGVPPEDPGVGRGHVPLEDPRVGRQGVPLKDPGVGKRGVPPEDPRVRRGHVPPDDPRVGRQGVPLKDPRVGRRGVPPEDPRVGKRGMPPEDPRVGRGRVPPEDPGVGRGHVPQDDTGVGRGHVSLEDPGVGRRGVSQDDTRAGRGRVPPEDPGAGRGQVPPNDPRVGRGWVPPEDPGVGRSMWGGDQRRRSAHLAKYRAQSFSDQRSFDLSFRPAFVRAEDTFESPK
nr:collagen alpha-1(I) chain [Manis javanica]